jgi:hypothetical protein
MTLRLQRGEIFIRETVPGSLVISWYPNSQADPNWPGLIMGSDELGDLPADAFRRDDTAAVLEWVNAQEWAQPLAPAEMEAQGKRLDEIRAHLRAAGRTLLTQHVAHGWVATCPRSGEGAARGPVAAGYGETRFEAVENLWAEYERQEAARPA